MIPIFISCRNTHPVEILMISACIQVQTNIWHPIQLIFVGFPSGTVMGYLAIQDRDFAPCFYTSRTSDSPRVTIFCRYHHGNHDFHFFGDRVFHCAFVFWLNSIVFIQFWNHVNLTFITYRQVQTKLEYVQNIAETWVSIRWIMCSQRYFRSKLHFVTSNTPTHSQ